MANENKNLFTPGDISSINSSFNGNKLDLATKLFYTYTPEKGTSLSDDEIGILKNSPKYKNVLVFIPEAEQIYVNGVFYGASNDLVNKIKTFVVSLLGEGAVDEDLRVISEDNISGKLADYVKSEADRIATENVINGLNAIKITDEDNIITIKSEGIENLSGERTFDLNINVDGNSVIKNGGALSAPIKLALVPSGIDIYAFNRNDFGNDVNKENTRLVVYANAYLQKTADTYSFLESNDENASPVKILDVIQVNSLVTDGMIDSVKYDHNTHKLTIEWNTDANKEPQTTIIDFDDLIDIKDLGTTDNAGKYFKWEKSRELHDENNPASDGENSEHIIKWDLDVNIEEYKTGSSSEDGINLSLEDKISKYGKDSQWSIDSDGTNISNYTLQNFVDELGTGGLVNGKLLAIELSKRDLVTSKVFTESKNYSKTIGDSLSDKILGLSDVESINSINSVDSLKTGLLKEAITKATDYADDKIKTAIEYLDSSITFDDQYLKYDISIDDGKLTEESKIKLKVAKIMDQAENGVINLSSKQEYLEGNLADAYDVARVIEAVETALESYVDSCATQIIGTVNDWVNDGAWKTIETGTLNK